MHKLSLSNIDTNPDRLTQIKDVGKKRGTGDYKNTLPVVDVEIPAAVTIKCPLTRNYISQAKNCKKCAHFNGVVQTTYNDEYEMQWNQKYAISCSCPVDRSCGMLCVED